ncbi:carbohydrate ABC transporter permease [Vagococcus carniphilus]|uniref:Carbohydrate ABC transporter permease n=1 Tax=Vagococcus carniphilus TaxID=218144 RepID=A0AAW8U4D2_9ENTE|nr:carbohydrate ABC transporter permease [Vagococcus carniphilus]MDT2814814.1 carbohydrate ABC transporter permease [Vagococcus carniphilus]MDT2832674.1 carbohydrate ABC transporter permease [Vagococcus carniphilus]MDT2849525.1 carbohydrate ABC transporter permease [Vagococcus carniphilus]MDT2864787.1 carbohydrate ABC transporter permease [Vagococcus carniphilus]
MSKKKIRITPIIGTILAIVWIFPFYLMVSNSLKTKREIFTNTLGTPKDLTFENYPQAFENLDFVRTFFNSLLITVVSVVFIVLLSSLASYALQRVKSKISGILFMLFVAAMLIPFQSVMIPLVTIFGKVNQLNMGGLIFMYIGFGSSMSIFLYHGAMKAIPKSLDEAAIIDGASRWQIFRYVIFPMLKPTTVTVALLNTMWIWNDYLLPSLVVNKEGTQTIPLKMFFFFGEYTKQWHLALAGLVIAIIPVIIFYFIMQKQIIAGVSDGAVK